MKQVNYDDNNNVLILSCRDDYSMSLVKGKDLGNYIENAVSMVSDDKISVNYIIEGDKSAEISSVIAAGKAIRRENEESTVNTVLTSEYTFENFIVGDCNRLQIIPAAVREIPFIFGVIRVSVRLTL